MAVHLIGGFGLLLAALGGAILIAPNPMRWLLIRAGIEPRPHQASRVGAWGLLLLGLLFVVVGRFV